MPRTALIKVRPRRYKKGDLVRIDSVIMHPMNTGLQKNKKTGKIPNLLSNGESDKKLLQ